MPAVALGLGILSQMYAQPHDRVRAQGGRAAGGGVGAGRGARRVAARRRDPTNHTRAGATSCARRPRTVTRRPVPQRAVLPGPDLVRVVDARVDEHAGADGAGGGRAVLAASRISSASAMLERPARPDAVVLGGPVRGAGARRGGRDRRRRRACRPRWRRRLAWLASSLATSRRAAADPHRAASSWGSAAVVAAALICALAAPLLPPVPVACRRTPRRAPACATASIEGEATRFPAGTKRVYAWFAVHVPRRYRPGDPLRVVPRRRAGSQQRRAARNRRRTRAGLPDVVVRPLAKTGLVACRFADGCFPAHREEAIHRRIDSCRRPPHPCRSPRFAHAFGNPKPLAEGSRLAEAVRLRHGPPAPAGAVLPPDAAADAGRSGGLRAGLQVRADPEGSVPARAAVLLAGVARRSRRRRSGITKRSWTSSTRRCCAASVFDARAAPRRGGRGRRLHARSDPGSRSTRSRRCRSRVEGAACTPGSTRCRRTACCAPTSRSSVVGVVVGRTAGRALAAAQYASCLIYDETANPVFDAWTREHGGGPALPVALPRPRPGGELARRRTWRCSSAALTPGRRARRARSQRRAAGGSPAARQGRVDPLPPRRAHGDAGQPLRRRPPFPRHAQRSRIQLSVERLTAQSTMIGGIEKSSQDGVWLPSAAGWFQR